MGLGDALWVWLAIGFSVVYGGGTYAPAHVGFWMAGIDAPPALLILVLTIVVLVAYGKAAKATAERLGVKDTPGIVVGALPRREGEGMFHCAFPADNLPQSPRHRYN
jgi:hypothetical protein